MINAVDYRREMIEHKSVSDAWLKSTKEWKNYSYKDESAKRRKKREKIGVLTVVVFVVMKMKRNVVWHSVFTRLTQFHSLSVAEPGHICSSW